MVDQDEVVARKVVMNPLLQSYIGSHRSSLPTPSLCVSLPVTKRNCEIFHDSLQGLDIDFRAHVKTHKTIEVTKLELGAEHHSIITSTIREIRGLDPLIADGTITDVLYGLPPARSYIPTLSSLSKTIPNLRLLIDHPAQLNLLSALPSLAGKPWSIYIKVDCGYHRAGIPTTSTLLRDLISSAITTPNISIYGFYVHAGHSYSASSENESIDYLRLELTTVFEAVKIFHDVHRSIGVRSDDKPLVLSIGTTPTAHVASSLKDIGALKLDGGETAVPSGCRLEIHAGNFPWNDLQQLATGVVPAVETGGGMAITVAVEVVSVYPERNEALINAGVLALGREPGQIPGFGRVRGREDWIVRKVSQEHGILAYLGKEGSQQEKVEDVFGVGDTLAIDVQHACVAAALHDWFFVMDEKDIVTNIWYPWRGWM